MTSRALVLAFATMLVIAAGSLPSATDVGAKRDRLKPTPCTAAPRSLADSAGQPAATPLPLDVVGFEADAWVDTPEDLPQGEPASEEIVAEITATVQEYAGCFNSGDGWLFAAMLSDNAIAHLGSLEEVVAALNEQAASDPRTIPWVRVDQVRELSDTRVGAVVTLGVLYGDGAKGVPQEAFFIFVREGDRWLFDGQINGEVDSSHATISPGDGVTPEMDDERLLATAREGFMEVDSALYAEPTLVGARLKIEAKVMVGFVGEDDISGVACELFTIERGEDSATVTTFCRADDLLAGRAAYLEVDVSDLRSRGEGIPYRCEYVAPLAEHVAFSCTVAFPPLTP
jgi:hypothetical protein